MSNTESTRGRLRARPAAELIGEAQPPGLWSLGLGSPAHGAPARGTPARGDHLLYAPAGCEAGRGAPLAVLLHGAGGDARAALDLLRGLADATGIILLAPTSREYTWDVIVGRYGPDVEAIDRALQETFSRYAVDPAHLAVGGFSDGGPPTRSL